MDESAPACIPTDPRPGRRAGALDWLDFDSGVHWIGHEGSGFAYDNEEPRHRVFLEPYRLASRVVTDEEYLAFIEDGGYTRPELWLSAGLAAVQERRWEAPLYWERDPDGRWTEFTLGGTRVLDGAALAEPVTHVSYYEADAFARWVLRGASCATPRSHARVSYRNFFPSDTWWRFSGIRLADAGTEVRR